MQATVETISNLERRLTVAMPMQPIEEEISRRLSHLARTVRMAGFRPGKVPMKLVVQQYGQQVRQEVISDKVEETLNDAIRQHALKVAGYPTIEPKPYLEGAEHYEYVATFEVMPEVQIGDLSGIVIERPKLKVVEADVDKTIEILRKQRATYEPVERGAEMGDRIEILFSSVVDGQKVEDSAGKTVAMVLGEGGRLTGFDDNLVGAKAGESRAFELILPADYARQELAGKTIRYEVEVASVAAPRLPEVDAEFARELGVEDGDVKKMRAEIKQSLQDEVDKRIKAIVKNQVMEGLLSVVTLELPKSLVNMEIGRLMEAARQGLRQRGLEPDGLGLTPAMFEEQAARNVKLRLIVAELVRSNALQATPAQVRAKVEEFSRSFEQPEEVVNWYYADPQRLNEPAAQATEDNLIDWVLERVKVKDKKIGFDELMAQPQA
ncbi:MAG: trigger factor [Methylophilaceae bacterium]|nr:trigger factor [Methylophilaceae bacterium]